MLATLSSVWHFFSRGGFFMVLLVICSIISGAIMLLRAFALRRKAVMPPLIEREIESLQAGESPDRIGRLAKGDAAPLARIVTVCLQHLPWPKTENTEAVQTKARHEVVRMEAGLAVLEMVTGMAPLLGLLGTVSGLVRVFAGLGAATGTPDTAGIAAGIAEALNTTIAGLVIAIPNLIAHSYFSKKVEVMSAEMESLVADLTAKCYDQKARNALRLAEAGTAKIGGTDARRTRVMPESFIENK